jgi:hypothetical protein
MLMRLEQFRHALGKAVGEDDLKTLMPVRVLVFRKGDRHQPSGSILTGRDSFAILQIENVPPSPALQKDLARLLLESNVARMPAGWERGLMDLFSTLDVTGIRITLGKPIAQPNRDWARAHLIATSTEYYGKMRVILYNLRRGVPPDAAYRNALGKGPAEVEAEVDRYFAAGKFPTTEVSPRPLAPSDFRERTLDPAEAQLALADPLLPESRAAYEAMLRDKINVPQAYEGLALLAARDSHKEDALRQFASAMAAGSKSARCYIEYARLEPDNSLAITALRKAIALNPKLAEPHFLMARRETEAEKRIADLKAAATLDPRQLPYWEALAQAHIANGNFSEAAKAWAAAEQAAATGEDRARMRQARTAVEGQRLDYEEAQRRRVAEEKARDLERLKAEARAEVRALEARTNRGAPTSKPDEKVVPWWEGPKAEGRARGTLKQVDCVGRQLRVVLTSEDGKLVRLLIPDPARVTVMGSGDLTLACGPQKARRISVEYFPKPNPKLATAGEVAVIEFQ